MMRGMDRSVTMMKNDYGPGTISSEEREERNRLRDTFLQDD